MNKLPLYKCHKIVAAAMILSMTKGLTDPPKGAELVLNVPDPQAPEQAHLSVKVDAAWLKRNPAVAAGDYFVEYELAPGETEPYTAYSPAAAFEAGYSPFDEMAAVQGATLNIAAVEDQVKIQCSDGNWNSDPYMFGMANGLICALATLKGESPEYLTAPDNWLSSRGDDQADETDQNAVASSEEGASTGQTPYLPHQMRVVDECEQLDKRLAKLQEFFASETFANLDHDNQHLLQCQANHMANYSQILHARIAAF